MSRDGETQLEAGHIGVEREIGVERLPHRTVVVGIQSHILYLAIVNHLAGTVRVHDGVVIGRAEVGAIDGQAGQDDGETLGLQGVFDALFEGHAAVGVIAISRQLVDGGVG